MRFNIKNFISLLFFCSIIGTTMSCSDDGTGQTWEFPEEEINPESGDTIAKPRFIWIDAAANFPDFANSKENIKRDLALAKEAGFTDIVVDVRPTSGDVLFKTTHVDQVKWLGAWLPGGFSKVHRTADWDYLQAFIEIGHELELKVYAGINTFVGGNLTSLGGNGMLYRDQSKKAWATTLLEKGADGNPVYQNTLEQTNVYASKFFNPVHEDVQEFLCKLVEDLAAYKDLDGIILDRGRFDELQSDFSDYTRKKFETFLGYPVEKYPDDIMAAGTVTGKLPNPLPKHFKKWLDFRAKTIHDFMEKAQTRAKAKNPDISFGVYVGGWYSSYYGVGVNWASPKYDTAKDFSAWASSDYKKYGYADLMDIILIGAYASPTSLTGSNEWTVEGFCRRAVDKIKGDAIVVGGPDIGNGAWDPNSVGGASISVVNAAIEQSVGAAINACDGYFLFDMIHLKNKDQWKYVKNGIDKYLETVNVD